MEDLNYWLVLIYVLLASRLTAKINSDPKFSLWLDRFVGKVFVASGIKLAVTSNT